MSRFLPRFLKKSFEGFEVLDIKENLNDGNIQIFIESLSETMCCSRCRSVLKYHGKYRQKLKHLPLFQYKTLVLFWRRQGYCEQCNKIRSEYVEFISEETPHHTKEYSFWVGRLCEIAAIRRVAELMDENDKSVWSMDFNRMKRMLKTYRIPVLKKITVDEVYARKFNKPEDKSASDKYFTIISDIESGKAVWVAESRRSVALEEFFILIGNEACKRIQIVATDDHNSYDGPIQRYCPQARHILDRFHIMKGFEEAVNETRKYLLAESANSDREKRLMAGKFRYIYLKKDSRRTEEEKIHIQKIVAINWRMHSLEHIKEKMLMFYNCEKIKEALIILKEIKQWIKEAHLKPLIKWMELFEEKLPQVLAFFQHRFTTALSEGINNVVKMLKRRAFGYKNMFYFRLKILQVCGYLNSRYIPMNYQ